MFEANVVATTMPPAPLTNCVIAGASVASDRPGLGENTLVESQVRTLTPLFAISPHKTGSNASPTMGDWSSLKSPVCTIRPAGVSITNAELSGIECEIGKNDTVISPTMVLAGHGSTMLIMFPSKPRSSNLRAAILPVNLRV